MQMLSFKFYQSTVIPNCLMNCSPPVAPPSLRKRRRRWRWRSGSRGSCCDISRTSSSSRTRTHRYDFRFAWWYFNLVETCLDMCTYLKHAGLLQFQSQFNKFLRQIVRFLCQLNCRVIMVKDCMHYMLYLTDMCPFIKKPWTIYGLFWWPICSRTLDWVC